MAETAPTVVSPSRKRPAPDDVESRSPHATPMKDPLGSPHSSDALSTPRTIASPEESPVPSNGSALRQTSPTPATIKKPTVGGTGTPSTEPKPSKRRKFTIEEKEQQRLEKEAKAKAREEQKAKKEEEIKQKEEAKKIKAEEKKVKEEQAKKEKEEKKREKELEKQQKEEEQRKKERSQKRLDGFFRRSTQNTLTTNDAVAAPGAESNNRRKSVSIEPGSPSVNRLSSPTKKPQSSDYERTFLPFELQSHTVCAPINWFWVDRSDAELEEARQRLDSIIGPGSEKARQEVITALKERNFAGLFRISPTLREKRGEKTPTVREVITQLQGSQDEPIDLTKDSPRQPLEVLKSIPVKYLHFGEDVRPPYCGTFTKLQPERESRKLARNPFTKSLPEINYDYDSEAEWEEPEEGEDIDIDDDEDIEEEGDDDLEGFLDDSDDPAQNRRKLITGDLEPVSSGICWEDNTGAVHRADGSVESTDDFSDYKMGVLLEPHPITINPFSTAYWQTEPAPASTSGPAANTLGLMNPPRLPLHTRPDGINVATTNNFNPQAKATNGIAAVPKPPKRMIPPELMVEFKEAIRGSDLTKLALIEALKKRFPKIPKDAITNTLPIVAARVGQKNSEKRWAILDT